MSANRHFRPLWLALPVMWLWRSRVLALPLIPLAALILLAVSVGRLLPLPESHLDAEGCVQPCWQSLRPGRTTLDEALFFIQADDLTDPDSLPVLAAAAAQSSGYISWETHGTPHYRADALFADGTLVQLSLSPQSRLTLGDVLRDLGTPSHAQLCPESMGWVAVVAFADHRVVVWASLPRGSEGRIDPEMQVMQLYYWATNPVPSAQWRARTAWHGFGRADYDLACG